MQLDTVYLGCDLTPVPLDPVVMDFSAVGLDYYYYSGTWNQLPNFTALTPADSGVVSNLDISGRLANDNFGFVFSGFLYLSQAGVYTFYTSSDDGSKLFINGVEVVNNDGLHGNTERSGTISLASGIHEVEVQFFEKGGGEVLTWKYEGPGLTKQAIPSSILYRSDPSLLTYSWTGPGGFSSTAKNPSVDQLGTYQLTVSNGTETVVDSLVVVSAEAPPVSAMGAWMGCEEDSVALSSNLSASAYHNGLNYAYYSGNWNVLPDFSALTALKTGTETQFSLDEREANDYFGFVFTGAVYLPTSGNYTFYTSSDDGSKLWIDGQLVVDNDGLHGARERSGTVSLSAGYHEIEVHFFERNGAAVLQVSYAGPGISKQEIPAGVLFTQAVPDYQYAWTGPNGYTASVAEPYVYGSGTYTLTLTDPSTGCSSTDTAEVQLNCAIYSGKFFEDDNQNGVLDGTEKSLDSLSVYMFKTNGTLLDSTTTDSSGEFFFAGIEPGDYEFEFARVPSRFEAHPSLTGITKRLEMGKPMYRTNPVTLGMGANLSVSYPFVNNGNLPVEWLDFTVQSTEEGLVLNWVTAWELNNERFEIERAMDGRHFSKIGAVPSRGNAQVPGSYQFVDTDETLVHQSLQWYYRLRQVDLDGQNSYSSVIRAEMEARQVELAVIAYPNPIQGPNLQIQYTGGAPGQRLQLSVISTLGQSMFATHAPAGINQKLAISVENWPEGYYFLQLEDGTQKRVFKVRK